MREHTRDPACVRVCARTPTHATERAFDDTNATGAHHGCHEASARRQLCKDLSFQYVQTSSRLVYKNSKPDFIVSTHRPLTEEEGKDLLSKRTMDFKVSYLDAGLSTQYFETGEPANSGTNGPKLNPR